uniref:CUB domain-containing protein n=1 Tax=Hucho hucho TaxID=62062 RepID=A0A4W5PRI8_9TELE
MVQHKSDFRSLLKCNFTTKPSIPVGLHRLYTKTLPTLLSPPSPYSFMWRCLQQGELTSPNWPNNYLDQAVCTWCISSAKNIHIVFTHFEVQAVNKLGQCVDYVEIYSGAGLTSQAVQVASVALPRPLRLLLSATRLWSVSSATKPMWRRVSVVTGPLIQTCSTLCLPLPLTHGTTSLSVASSLLYLRS